jgi:hypothetical protein
MQTALDKLHQEIDLAKARGQSLTRHPSRTEQVTLPPESALPEPAKTTWVAYGIAIIGALLALSVVGFAFSRIVGNAPPTATTSATALQAIETLPPTAAFSPDATAAALIATVIPTDTPFVVPMLIPPTTQVPPAFSSTPAILSASPIIPVSTGTSTPTIVPTAISPTSTMTSSPAQSAPRIISTVLYPGGKLFVLMWSAKTFYVSNQSGGRVGSTGFSFERLTDDGGTGNKFLGGRWAGFYPWSENGKCLVLRMRSTSDAIPRDSCPFGVNADANAFSGELFWTVGEQSTQFRVLWNNAEIARCPIDQGRCEVRIP